MKALKLIICIGNEDGEDMTERDVENMQQTLEDLCDENDWVQAGEVSLVEATDEELDA